MNTDSVTRTPSVVAYGGGLNSTALLVGIIKRQIPIDLILFADTGGEKPETYAYIDLLSFWLHSKGYPQIGIVRKVNRIREIRTLEEDCLEKGMLPSIAYGYKSCSQKYKIQPQEKFINHWPPAISVWKQGGKVVKYIGYDAGEEYRAKIESDDKYHYIYPLIEWNWGREECADTIRAEGLPVPVKSSCFFCPSMKKKEILELQRMHPELLRRAIRIEESARPNLTHLKGLGRSWAWKDFVQENETEIFPEIVREIPCGCYDG